MRILNIVNKDGNRLFKEWGIDWIMGEVGGFYVLGKKNIFCIWGRSKRIEYLGDRWGFVWGRI